MMSVQYNSVSNKMNGNEMNNNDPIKRDAGGLFMRKPLHHYAS